MKMDDEKESWKSASATVGYAICKLVALFRRFLCVLVYVNTGDSPIRRCNPLYGHRHFSVVFHKKAAFFTVTTLRY